VFEGGGSNLTPAMLRVLIFCILAFTLFYLAVLSLRLGIEWAQEQVEQLRYE
jgi:hypothetical protein